MARLSTEIKMCKVGGFRIPGIPEKIIPLTKLWTIVMKNQKSSEKMMKIQKELKGSKGLAKKRYNEMIYRQVERKLVMKGGRDDS